MDTSSHAAPSPRADLLTAAIERGDQNYLLEWIEDHAQSIEQVRDAISRFWLAQEDQS